MSTSEIQPKVEDDDLELYGDINEDLVDPDAVQDERDEGAVASALTDEKPAVTPAPIPTFTGVSQPGYGAQGYNAYANQSQDQAQGSSGQYDNDRGNQSQNNYAGNYQSQNQGGYQGHSGGYPNAQGDVSRLKSSESSDEGKMFIGGLNWETSDTSLQTYFSQFGPVTACAIMRDPMGRSRGFAFLTFENAASVNAVMAKEHILDGKIIDPKRAIPRAEHVKSQKVFVGGLAPSVNNASLKAFFSDYGHVMDAHVMFDRETNRNKGFGFVTFEDDEGVERAMQATGEELEGKPIEVKKAQPKHARDQNDGSRRHIGSYMAEGAQSAKYNHSSGGPQMGNPMMGGMGMGGMGGMPAMGGNAFDPQAMAMMYQRMMMSMMGGMNPMMNMNMMNQNPQGNGMNPMGGGMPNAGGAVPNPMGGAAYNPMMMMNNMGSHTANGPTDPAAAGTIPRGPAGVRPGQGVPTAPSGGGQPARYSTQGQARSKPY